MSTAEKGSDEPESNSLAKAAEDTDKMGQETAGDEGRGEEAGEGLASNEGAALGNI